MPSREPPAAAHELVDRLFRDEQGRAIATLIRVLGDFDLAEEAVQDAFIAALETWPARGVPDNPGAWITTTARNRAIDRLRRRKRLTEKIETLARDATTETELRAIDPESAEDAMHIADDRLRLIFTCCHPALAMDARVALTLRVLGGLTTPEIARAFLLPEPTLAQRLVRAKRKIRAAGIPYRVPPPELLAERLTGVLHVLYLVFNEGYSATSGDLLVRRELSSEAIRLTRLVDELLPGEPEILGLLALMLLHDARREARVGSHGELILLDDQDRSRWDRDRIVEGQALVERALRMGRPGPYQVQAAIAALHDEAVIPAATDWSQIASLYRALAEMAPSPVVELNLAVAVAMADGPAVGLATMDGLANSGELDRYSYLHSARADLLRRLERRTEAAAAYRRAIELTTNRAEQAYLRRRLAEVSTARGAERRPNCDPTVLAQATRAATIASTWAVVALTRAMTRMANPCETLAMTRERRGPLARLRRAVKCFMISGPGRARWQRPDDVVAALGIRSGDRIADIGAGGGYFTTHLARATGPKGITYAIDTDEDMLDSVEEAARQAGLTNIRPIRAEPEGPTLPERVDLAFLCNVYHHLPDQRRFFERLATQLSPRARVAIVEALPGGLAARLFGHVTPAERIREEMLAAGYQLQATHDLLTNRARQSFQVFSRGDTVVPADPDESN